MTLPSWRSLRSADPGRPTFHSKGGILASTLRLHGGVWNPPVGPTAGSIASVATVCAAAVVVFITHLVVARLLPVLVGRARWHRAGPSEQHLCVHETVTSFILSPVLVVLYAVAVYQLGVDEDNTSKWHSSVAASKLALTLHAGMTLYDTCFAYPLDRKKTFMYYAHHVVTLVVFFPIILYDKLHYYASCTALVEATNPFVGIVQNIDRLSLIDDSTTGDESHWNWRRINFVTGSLLLPTWFIVRIVGLPFVMWRFANDAPALLASVAHLSAGERRFIACLSLMCFSAVGLIWMLSCVWFRQMVLRAVDLLAEEEKISPPGTRHRASGLDAGT